MPINYLPRQNPNSHGPGPWAAVGRGARGIGSMLMQIAASRKEDEALQQEKAYRESQDLAEQQRYDTNQTRLGEQETYDRGRDTIEDQRWFDTESGRRGDVANRLRLEGATVSNATPTTQQQIAMPGQLLSEVVTRPNRELPQYMVTAPPPRTFTAGGREFAEGPEGEAAALDWGSRWGDATRAPPGGTEDVSWQTITTDQGIMERNPRTGEVRPLQFGGVTLQPPGEDDDEWRTRITDAEATIGAPGEPERDKVPGLGGIAQRLLPFGRSGYVDDPGQSLLGKQGLSAETPPDSTPTGSLQGAIPSWFRDQHRAEIEAGATDVPRDINEAWREFNGGR